jgi:hypothetical protein
MWPFQGIIAGKLGPDVTVASKTGGTKTDLVALSMPEG